MNDVICDRYERHFMLLLDEQLEGELRVELMDHVVACHACRAHYDWLAKAEEELTGYGDSFTDDLPEFDAIDDVLAAVRVIKQQNPVRETRGEIVAFDRKIPALKKNKHAFPTPWLGAAAAALLVAVSLWFVLPLLDDATENQRSRTATPTLQPNGSSVDDPLNLNPVRVQYDDTDTQPAPQVETDASVPPPPPPRPQRYIDRGQMVASFQDAVSIDDPDRSRAGSDRLSALAQLSREEAEALLANGVDSPLALAGMADSLSMNDRRRALLTAAGSNRNDPYYRYRLLREYQQDPLSQDLAQQELIALAELDQENAIVQYTEAQMHLAQDPPNVAAALDALAIANGLDRVSTYTVENAEAREAALLETGVDPVTAELLGALTAGYWEYNELTVVADDLMASADALAAQGETGRAIEIYEAVREMGSQLGTGAQFAQERLAGVEIETAALAALDQYYGTGPDSPEAQRIREASHGLAVTMGELVDHFQRSESFLGISLENDSALSNLANSILSFGDIFTFAAGALDSRQQ